AHYGTGAIMAVPGNDERDNEFAKQFDLPIVFTAKEKNDSNDGKFIAFSKEIKIHPEKYMLINSEEFNDLDFKKGREAILKKLTDAGVANKEVTYKLRDWLISRQRYWGAPIP